MSIFLPCISVRQPWAWAILHAGKDVENRTWNTNHRGPCLLHASKTCTRLEHFEACQAISAARGFRGVPVPDLEGLDLGGIVGAFDLYDVFRPGERQSPWHVGAFGFRLRNVVPLEFRPYRGALALFTVELTDAEAAKLQHAGLLP